MSRKNYKQKIKKGVRNYVVYEIEIDGTMFVLKCEAKKIRNHIEEQPYSLKIKKE